LVKRDAGTREFTELASGHRVHESGILVQLTAEEWTERWEQEEKERLQEE
jgi:hypothetical protein